MFSLRFPRQFDRNGDCAADAFKLSFSIGTVINYRVDLDINSFVFFFFPHSIVLVLYTDIYGYTRIKMGRKFGDISDMDNLISPVYALSTADDVGWMGYKAVPVAEPKPRAAFFLIDIGISTKTIDAILHILVIFLVLFIIINCMCKFIWMFIK